VFACPTPALTLSLLFDPPAQRFFSACNLALAQVVLEKHMRNRKKMTTTVTGLELFGIKLAEASKLFGKKFACGCSVTKTATGGEQVDMQVRRWGLAWRRLSAWRGAAPACRLV
jgi:translation initiation factor 1 (eIF-1/SUI1)